MALSWCWAFAHPQTWAKLTSAGWVALSGITPEVRRAKVNAPFGDSDNNRAAIAWRVGSGGAIIQGPAGTMNSAGWFAASVRADGTFGTVGLSYDMIGFTDGTTTVKVSPTTWAATTTIALSINGSVVATSTATASINQFHRLALKYDGSTTTLTISVYLDGVEIIAPQTGTITALTAADLRPTLRPCAASAATHYADLACWDSTSDSGEVAAFYASAALPTSDDSDSGGWTKSTGSTFHGVLTPWDVSTYAEEASPTSGDYVLTGCESIAARTGITPANIHGATAHLAASGGGDVQAIIQDTSTTGSTVTTHATDPTLAYVTSTTITPNTALKCGIKVA